MSSNATKQAETNSNKNSGRVRPVQKEVNISDNAELVQQKSVKSIQHAPEHSVDEMLLQHRRLGHHRVGEHEQERKAVDVQVVQRPQGLVRPRRQQQPEKRHDGEGGVEAERLEVHLPLEVPAAHRLVVLDGPVRRKRQEVVGGDPQDLPVGEEPRVVEDGRVVAAVEVPQYHGDHVGGDCQPVLVEELAVIAPLQVGEDFCVQLLLVVFFQGYHLLCLS